MPVFSADQLERMAADVFERTGASADGARTVAEHLVAANLAGHDSHGVLRIAQYVELIDAGKLNPRGQMRVVERFAGGAVVEGDQGFGQVIAGGAMRLAIEIARTGGIGAVTVRNCCHTGRIGTYTEMAAAANMVGIAMTNAGGGGQLVTPFGGTARRLSTNPISIAAPSAAGHPIVLDMATSVAPEGKVRAAYQAGKSAPEGWMIDAQGRPTTNPADFYSDPPAALVPLGGAWGYKGYCLAFMVDILAGALSGAGCCRPKMIYPGDGMLAIAIDVAHFGPADDFGRRVAELVEYVKDCPRAPGVEAIRVPGEIEWRKRDERLREGIPIEPGSWALIEKACRRFEVDFPSSA
jgi:uncharacterized oxidoreductase